jgi:hypothetical protein
MARNPNQYTETSVLGRDFSVPTLAQSIQHRNNVTTPEWMIKIDDYLSSTIEGMTDNPLPEGEGDITYSICAELFGWFDEQARLTKGNTANQLFSTSAVQQSTVGIVIPNGEYVPSLEQVMYAGVNIKEIHIVRLGNIEDLKVPLQIVSYTTSKIDSIQQKLDEVVLSFRPATRQNTNISYNQDGTPRGRNVSAFDFTKGSATFTSGGGGGAAAPAA